MFIKRPILIILISLVILAGLAAYGILASRFLITDAWMSSSSNADMTLRAPTDTFPKGTSKIFCGFQWDHARSHAVVIAKWYYETEALHILDSAFVIPVNKGHGTLSLTMPNDKPFPSGQYRCDITINGMIIKSLLFKVL